MDFTKQEKPSEFLIKDCFLLSHNVVKDSGSPPVDLACGYEFKWMILQHLMEQDTSFPCISLPLLQNMDLGKLMVLQNILDGEPIDSYTCFTHAQGVVTLCSLKLQIMLLGLPTQWLNMSQRVLGGMKVSLTEL